MILLAVVSYMHDQFACGCLDLMQLVVLLRCVPGANRNVG